MWKERIAMVSTFYFIQSTDLPSSSSNFATI
ncbi:MAG: DNA alkylation repair protein [Endomicrobium sp.]|nr:DNA alkylation repair protein [Endomicrobium sp.]